MKSKKIFYCLIVLLALGSFLPKAEGDYPIDRWLYTGGEYCISDFLFPFLCSDFTISGGSPASPAVGGDGTVYTGSNNGYFFAINPNGTPKWATYLGGAVGNTPAIADNGTIYVHNGYHLYALDPSNGEIVDETSDLFQNYLFLGSPAIAKDGTVYIGTDNNKFFAFSPDLTKLWEAEGMATVGSGVFANPVIDSSGTIYCLYGTGGQTWLYSFWPNLTLKNISHDLGPRYLPNLFSPAIGRDGTIYVVASVSLYALSPEDLEIEWTSDPPNYPLGPSGAPVIGYDDFVYVPFWNILAIVINGVIPLSIDIGDEPRETTSTPAIGKDWMVYFGTGHFGGFVGRLRAVDYGLYPVWDIGVDHVGPFNYSSPAIVSLGNQGVLSIGLDSSVRAWTVSSPGIAFTSWPVDRGNLKRNGRVRPAFLGHMQIAELKVSLPHYGFTKGITSSLNAKLDSAMQSMEEEHITPAMNKINAFINEVSALKGKQIPAREATALIADAERILNLF